MTWAIARRLDYIDWHLVTAGEVQRADIMQQFGVSETIASGDLNEFLRLHPAAMAYDKSRKRYVPANGRYRSVRGWTPSAIAAMRALTTSRHPMAWMA